MPDTRKNRTPSAKVLQNLNQPSDSVAASVATPLPMALPVALPAYLPPPPRQEITVSYQAKPLQSYVEGDGLVLDEDNPNRQYSYLYEDYKAPKPGEKDANGKPKIDTISFYNVGISKSMIRAGFKERDINKLPTPFDRKDIVNEWEDIVLPRLELAARRSGRTLLPSSRRRLPTIRSEKKRKNPPIESMATRRDGKITLKLPTGNYNVPKAKTPLPSKPSPDVPVSAAPGGQKRKSTPQSSTNIAKKQKTMTTPSSSGPRDPSEPAPQPESLQFLENYEEGHLKHFNLVQNDYKNDKTPTPPNKCPRGKLTTLLPSLAWASWTVLARSPGGRPLPFRVIMGTVKEWIPALSDKKDQSFRVALCGNTDGGSKMVNKDGKWRLKNIDELVEKKSGPPKGKRAAATDNLDVKGSIPAESHHLSNEDDEDVKTS